MRACLTGSARIVAHEALLLLALGADHRMRVLSRVALFGAELPFVTHAFWADRRAQATTLSSIAFRALRVPQKSPLLASLAHFLGSPTPSNGVRLLAIGAVAAELWRAEAPAEFVDTHESVFTHRVAQVVGLFQSWSTLAYHLTDVTELGLQPARLLPT